MVMPQEHNMVLGIRMKHFPKTTEYIYFQSIFKNSEKTGSYYREWITEPVHKKFGRRSSRSVYNGTFFG